MSASNGVSCSIRKSNNAEDGIGLYTVQLLRTRNHTPVTTIFAQFDSGKDANNLVKAFKKLYKSDGVVYIDHTLKKGKAE